MSLVKMAFGLRSLLSELLMGSVRIHILITGGTIPLFTLFIEY